MMTENLLPQDFAAQVAEDEFCKVEEAIAASVTHEKKENSDVREQVLKILTPEVKNKYLDSFEGLSKEKLANKDKFFDATINAITNRINRKLEEGAKIDDIDSFARKTLSNGDIYSKINKVIVDVRNKDKNMFENPNANINKHDTDMNEEEKFDKEVERRNGKPTGVPETWSDAEKAAFDAAFRNGGKAPEMDYDAWTDEEKAVFDKEFAAGNKAKTSEEEKFDPKTMDTMTDEEKAAFDKEFAAGNKAKTSDEEKFDPKTMDTMTPEEKAAFDKEFAEGNAGTQKDSESGDGKHQEMSMEQLKQNLAEARRNYTKIHRKSEDIVGKIKGFFSDVDTGQDADVANASDAYQKALEAYRNAQLNGVDKLPEVEQQKVMEELKSFDLNEKVALYDDRVGAKSESMVHGAILAYKKMPMKYKLAISGALFAGSTLASVGAAAGLFGGLIMFKRMLGAGVAGVGATGWAEARAHKKEQSGIQAELETFGELSLEQQKAQLAGFDDNSFKQLNKEFKGKISGRGRRVMLGMGAAAGVMALGSAGKIFFGTEHVDNGINASGMNNAENALGGVSSEGGVGNSELIQKVGREAFGKNPSFNTELPEMPEMSAPELSDVSIEVKSGDNLWNIIKGQLETNNQLSGMTEDQRIMAIDELKDKFAKMNPDELRKIGFTSGNIDKIIPGNHLNLTDILGNTDSVQHSLDTGRDFSGNLEHISMEGIKGEMAQRAAETEAFDKVKDIGANTAESMNLEDNGNLTGAMQGGVATEQLPDNSTWINPDNGNAFVSDGGSATEQLPTMPEVNLISELMKNPEFNISVAEQIKEMTGMEDIHNIAGANIKEFLIKDGNEMNQKINNLMSSAKKVFGGNVGTPKDGATVGSYMTRIFARAVQEGKVKDLFPSSKFSL